jgi:parvulin-like peptidyl-prolyl isomerase
MRRLFQFVLVLLTLGSVPMQAGEVIDRIAATVNNGAILLSDVEQALRCEALMDGRHIEKLTVADQNAALQRLIDQELLRQQMGKDIPEPESTEISEQLQQVRGQISGASSDEGWRSMLAQYGVHESEVAERVAVQMRIERFLEQRLRPGVRVDQASIQAYYNEQFLPKLKNSGVQHVPELREVRRQIQEILLQQRMDEELASWLRSLREQGHVRISMGVEAAPASGHDHPGPGGNGG